MNTQTARQIALMTVFASCALMVTIVLALGLGAATGAALMQASPLVVALAAALAFLLSDSSKAR
jgi:drug/metabolite transporter (DMT)-like permease